jgi:hypothetical protein
MKSLFFREKREDLGKQQFSLLSEILTRKCAFARDSRQDIVIETTAFVFDMRINISDYDWLHRHEGGVIRARDPRGSDVHELNTRKSFSGKSYLYMKNVFIIGQLFSQILVLAQDLGALFVHGGLSI